MSNKYDFRMAESDPAKQVTLSFVATWLAVQNLTSKTLYVREGSVDTPNSDNADYEVISGQTLVVPVKSGSFCFAMGAVSAIVSPAAYSQSASKATVLLGDASAVVPTATQSQQPKPSSYIDRNPVSQTLQYTATLNSVTAAITRATYTVPVGKKAVLQNTYISILQNVSSGCDYEVDIYKNGTNIIDRIALRTSNLNITTASTTSGDRLLYAGDTITFVTIENTATSFTLIMSAIITEFDG